LEGFFWRFCFFFFWRVSRFFFAGRPPGEAKLPHSNTLPLRPDRVGGLDSTDPGNWNVVDRFLRKTLFEEARQCFVQCSLSRRRYGRYALRRCQMRWEGSARRADLLPKVHRGGCCFVGCRTGRSLEVGGPRSWQLTKIDAPGPRPMWGAHRMRGMRVGRRFCDANAWRPVGDCRPPTDLEQGWRGLPGMSGF